MSVSRMHLAPPCVAAKLDMSIFPSWPMIWTLPLLQLAVGLMRKGPLLEEEAFLFVTWVLQRCGWCGDEDPSSLEWAKMP